MVGETISHYRILEKLGGGGMGVVYRAEDTRLGRQVALKFISDPLARDPQSVDRFRREARAASALNHTNICTIYDIGEHEGKQFIVMELLEGQALNQLLCTRSVRAAELLELGTQIAAALAAAHAKGIVHRDIKPANIFVAGGQVKLLDFGLAKLAPQATPADDLPTEMLTRAHALPGTLPYMSPEQLRGDTVDERADIYALGVVLYEMAAGRRPFDASSPVRLADAILHQAPEPLTHTRRDITPRLEEIILKCLEKDADNRYQSTKELLVDLRRAAAPEAAVVQTTRTGRRTVVAWVIAALAMAAALVAWNAGVRDRIFPPSSLAVHSLAVLPLQNLSGDPEHEYFADGMTEALIAELSKIKALKVISRTSVMQYKGVQKSASQIARELNVEGLVEGSVLREGDRVRITVQLIHGSSDKHLWAESYHREVRGILVLQSQVAQAIAREIRVAVTPEEAGRFTVAGPINPEAHALYVKGRHFYHQEHTVPPGLRKSIQLFQDALKIDPGYAPAYVGLADSLIQLQWLGAIPARDAFAQAKAAAEKAFELDPALGDAHISLGAVHYWGEWDWLAAEQSFRRGIELSPGSAHAYDRFAFLMASLNRVGEGIALIRRAQELAPLSEDINVHAAWLLFYDRQYEAAIQELRKVMSLHPNSSFARFILGRILTEQGKHEEALQVFLGGKAPSGAIYWPVGYTLARAGRPADARRALEQHLKRRVVEPAAIAILHASLGEKDKAFEWLEKTYQQHESWIDMIRIDPFFDSLRSDPRYDDFVRRMKFPP